MSDEIVVVVEDEVVTVVEVFQGLPGTDGIISEVRDEGAAVTDGAALDFTGSGVSVSSGGNVITVNVVSPDNVNILDHEAVDGGDSTDAIQDAIDAVNTADGGVVFVPEGTFLHSGLTLSANVTLQGAGEKSSILRYSGTTGNGITVTGRNTHISDLKLNCSTTSTGAAVGSSTATVIADFSIDRYEIEGFLTGVYIPNGLQIEVGFGRLIGQGKAVSGGVGVQIGDRPNSATVNTANVEGAYASGYETNFVMDGTVHRLAAVTSETCINAVMTSARLLVEASWIQADTYLYRTRSGGWTVMALNNLHYNGSSVEQDDVTSMCDLSTANDLGVVSKNEYKSPGKTLRLRLATSRARGLAIGASEDLTLWSNSGAGTLTADGARPLELDRNAAGAVSVQAFRQQGTIRGGIGYDAAGAIQLLGGSGLSAVAAKWDASGNFMTGQGLATDSTNGFLYVPTCPGTPTGTPTAKSGWSPIVVDSTNDKLYFYSGGAWRDAGP